MSVVDFSSIDVDDMLQLRMKKQFFYMLLHMCSIWACHPSRRCSVTFPIFRPSSDSLIQRDRERGERRDRDRDRQIDRQRDRDRKERELVGVCFHTPSQP